MPFSIVGSNTLLEVNGKRVRGRLYPWGVVEVENKDHCDFVKLRNMLIRWVCVGTLQVMWLSCDFSSDCTTKCSFKSVPSYYYIEQFICSITENVHVMCCCELTSSILVQNSYARPQGLHSRCPLWELQKEETHGELSVSWSSVSPYAHTSHTHHNHLRPTLVKFKLTSPLLICSFFYTSFYMHHKLALSPHLHTLTQSNG